MGTRWGINRSVAQIHALLYLSPKALTAEEIAETLSVARSNVSTSLRELQGWGIVKVVHVLGDRRDHFESMKDVWEMFQVIMDERKRRECDPSMALLRECVEQCGESEQDAETHRRLLALLEFFETTGQWYKQIRSLPTQAMIKFVKLGNRMGKMVGIG